MTQDFTPLVGVVLATSNRAIQFNFGQGELWVPRCLIQEDTFVIGSIQTFNLATWLAIREGLVS